MGTKAGPEHGVGRQIHFQLQDRFQIVGQADEDEHPRRALELHEQIEVALLGLLAPGVGAEDGR